MKLSKPSNEQIDIINQIGVSNVIVDAVAGSGKTI
jgi:DNA helicase IV